MTYLFCWKQLYYVGTRGHSNGSTHVHKDGVIKLGPTPFCLVFYMVYTQTRHVVWSRGINPRGSSKVFGMDWALQKQVGLDKMAI